MKRSGLSLVCILLVALFIAVPVMLQGPLSPEAPLANDIAARGDIQFDSALSASQTEDTSAVLGQAAALQDAAAPPVAKSESQSVESEYEPDAVLVRIADSVSLEEVNAELATLDFTTTRQIGESDVSHGYVELELAQGFDVNAALARLEDVEFAVEAQPNFIYHVCDETAAPAGDETATPTSAPTTLQIATAQEIIAQESTAQSTAPDDPKLSSQWALTAVNAFGAWDYARGEHKVTVAILDSGLDMDHPDFADKNGTTNVIGGYSVLQANKSGGDSGNYNDTYGHGTHVAGIIAAATDNNEGVSGVSYNANIMPVQVIDSNGSVSSSNAAKGIDHVISYAAEHPEANVKVINLSFGTDSPYESLVASDRTFTAALTRAYNAGILVVCAAGNGGDDYSVAQSGAYRCFPCDYASEAIGVINATHATTSNGTTTYSRYSGSNYNMANQRTKELTAPGTTILSTTYDGAYGNKSGTSMASPYVAGVAALVFAANPNKTASEVKQVLIETATDLNESANIDGKFDLETGYGMVNAEAAVKASAAYLSEGDILMAGNTLQLSVENGSGLSWTWTSSDTGVATVSSSGLVTGVAAGKATISAKLSNSVTLYREVSVYDPAIAGDSTVEYGALSQLTVPAANPTSAWVFESSDTGVITIGATTGRFVAMGVGSATVTVHLNGNESVASMKTITVTQADLANATLDGVEDQPYTGAAVTLPDLAVIMPDYTRAPSYTARQLTDGTGTDAGDYTVSYSPNVERGQVTVTVTAKDNSNYKGSQSATFRIVNGSVKNATLAGTGTYTYTGQPITVADLQVTAESGEMLEQGTDYEVVYPADHTSAGRVYITINGINNYGGSVQAYFVINAVSISSDDVKLTGIADKTYTGSAITQAPILTYNGMTLKQNTDYAISYLNNTNVGTAVMYIQGLGNYATYSGIFPTYRIATFAIGPADISGATVKFDACTYNGAAQRPTPTVTFGGETLTAGTDFTVEYPADCTNAGAKQVTVKAVTGTGKNFAGTKSDSATRYTIDKKAATIAANSKSKAYDGTALTAAQAGYTASGFVSDSDVVYVSFGGSVTNVGKATSTVSSYTLSAAANNNYTVTKKTGTLQVTAADISLATITLAQTSYTYDGTAKNPAVTVTLGTKTLKGSSTYTSSADYVYTYSNNVNPGTATVKIQGVNNYANTTSTTFTIAQNDAQKGHSVRYRTHVQTYGWQGWKSDGATSGTSGQSKRLEAINIELSDKPYAGSIQYRTHVQTYGWQGWKSDGAMAGTSGEAKRLEAIQIQLTGAMAEHYDVWYCVHAQHYGWMGWAKNGAMAGTAGYAYRLEAIQVKILPKGSSAPGSTFGAYRDASGTISGFSGSEPSVVYRTHVQTYGWQDWVYNGAMSGTSGQSKRLEGINIKLGSHPYAGSIQYRTHVQTYGWQGWKSDGAMAGTSGEAKRLEAIQIQLTGAMAEHYDVWYCVHAQHYGLMGWAKNGAMAGTAGYAYRLEAIQVKILPKGSSAPGSTAAPFLQK